MDTRLAILAVIVNWLLLIKYIEEKLFGVVIEKQIKSKASSGSIYSSKPQLWYIGDMHGGGGGASKCDIGEVQQTNM